MTEYTYFANRASLTVDTKTVAVLKGLEITTNYEIEKLYGMDSIERQDVANHTLDIEVKISAAKFDPSLTTGFSSIYGGTLSGDEASPALTVTDTNDVAVFDVVATIQGTGQTTTTTITITDVYFESLPFPASENDFIVFELTGHGKNVTFATA